MERFKSEEKALKEQGGEAAGAQKNGRGPREESITRQNLRLSIKARLAAAVNKYLGDTGMKEHAFWRELENKYDLSLNQITLFNTASTRKGDTLDIYCVIAICKYLNLDIGQILSDPLPEEVLGDIKEMIKNEESRTRAQMEKNNRALEVFGVLDDKKYHGIFYGYFYSSKISARELDSFRLTIGYEKLTCFAQMELHVHTIDAESGRETVRTKMLRGKPKLVNGSIVYIEFTDPSGIYYVMSFNYKSYRNSGLYYRRGALLTQARDEQSPLLQSFVFFKKEAAPENYSIIRGMLRMSDKKFLISEDSLSQLIVNDKDIAYLAEHSGVLRSGGRVFYEINEDDILTDETNELSGVRTLDSIQKLKLRSSAPTIIHYPEDGYYSDFSKTMGLSRETEAEPETEKPCSGEQKGEAE